LLERLGFSSAQLSTPVKDLSGGQQRRLQLLLILLDQPNVLILDEPTNDLDTDMLAALEDLLDSWPGTLIVVSHDRYFIERVTDQQYAVLDHHLRHLPGGVDEYLRRRAAGEGDGKSRPDARSSSRSNGASGAVPDGTGEASGTGAASSGSGLSGQDARAARKEVSALERKMEKTGAAMADLDTQMTQHDPSDYAGLANLQAERAALQEENDAYEERWLELSELLG
jgi:ABC-type multidrug transport system ATPase subunit